MSRQAREVYFVGSIPLDQEYRVFSALADHVGERATRVPDGEFGDRIMWVISQYPVLAACSALESTKWPSEGITRRTVYQLPLKLRDRANESELNFEALGYARHALASYTMFREMKAAGKVPAIWRFQVNLPTPMDVMPLIVPEHRRLVEPAYERALLRELRHILTEIPHDELAITWDVVQGLLVFEDPDNKYVTLWFDEPKKGIVERLLRLGSEIPADVELGYHLCYGSQDHKHALEPKDLSASVELANAIADRLGRKIDYFHVAVPRNRDDDAYFRPLANLDSTRIGKVFLGLVHYSDGVEGAAMRIRTAEKYLADFGIATECGFGRRPKHQDVIKLIQLHAEIEC